MVRFHWHVEGGLSAFIAGPQTVIGGDGDDKVYEMPCYIELAGQKDTFEGIINVKNRYFEDQRIQPVGVALAHDTDVVSARGSLIAKLALELAKEGKMTPWPATLESSHIRKTFSCCTGGEEALLTFSPGGLIFCACRLRSHALPIQHGCQGCPALQAV